VSYKKPDPMSLLTIAILAAVALWIGGAFKKAHSAEANLSWTPPTEYVDGTPLPPDALGAYKVYFGLSTTDLQVGTIPAPATETAVPIPTTGTWYFAVTAVTTTGAESEKSEFVSKAFDVLDPTPVPPGNLTVLATRVYSVAKTTNKFLLVPVGTVPVGTPCDPTQSVNGHYAVPRTAVTWSGLVRPAIVVAKC